MFISQKTTVYWNLSTLLSYFNIYILNKSEALQMYTNGLKAAVTCSPVPTGPITSLVHTVFWMKTYTKINTIKDKIQLYLSSQIEDSVKKHIGVNKILLKYVSCFHVGYKLQGFPDVWGGVCSVIRGWCTKTRT